MFFVALAKIELKIEKDVILYCKVLQNGCKYTQDSTTLLFSINFIALSVKNLKIVKNYYGAPPPPELERAAADDLSFISFTKTFLAFISFTSSFSSGFSVHIVYKNVFSIYIIYKLILERFLSFISAFSCPRSCSVVVEPSQVFVEKNVNYEKKVLQNGCKYTQDSTILLFSINFITLSYPQNSSTSFSIIFIALSANLNIRCHG